MSGIPGISAFPQSDNLLQWVATLQGPSGTPYEGLAYKLSLSFPCNYPYKAPTVKFETKCYHPNVDMSGNICLDILKVYYDKWWIIVIFYRKNGRQFIMFKLCFYHFNLYLVNLIMILH